MQTKLKAVLFDWDGTIADSMAQVYRAYHPQLDRYVAMKVLRSRLLDIKIAEENAKYAAFRKDQVGTGERSEKIRTYNFPQNRVTDHRVGITLHKLELVMEGDLDELVLARTWRPSLPAMSKFSEVPGPVATDIGWALKSTTLSAGRAAVFTATCRLSPVIMTVRIPAARAFSRAGLTSTRGGSIMPIRPTKIRSCSRLSGLISPSMVETMR